VTGPLDRASLAVDHALGLTEAAEAERAERLMATDSAFARMVESWREHLSEIDLTAPERAPPPGHLAAIEARLEETGVRPLGAGTRPGLVDRLWSSLGFWRPAGLLAAAAAVLLALGLWQNLARGPAQPVYVAVLETGEGRPAAVVNAYADGTVTLVPLERIGVPRDRILEVWTLQTRERGPVSVGRMDAARTLKLDLKDLGRPSAGHLFEITVEPPGGSPTGRPTGPILMKGLANTAL
jgi:anti-sigma-K factor RskA